MAISGIQQINIGEPNESIGSDSLYTAFKKTANNFANLFACASPFNTFTGSNGITVVANASVGTLDIQNSGVTNIIAGTGVSVNQSNGNVIISSTGSGGGAGTVTSVGLAPVSTSRLVVTNTPIVSSGIITIDLATSGVGSGTYTYPTLTVDSYGRITSIANAASVGTVTSVGAVAGSGIQVSGGPITSSGSLTIVNTGVTSLSAGTGIQLSGSNGNITVSTVTTSGTVSSIVITSSTLNVTNGTITTTGVVDIELPTDVDVTGQFLLSGSENLGDGNAASLSTVASYFTTTTASTATLAAGTNGQIKTFMMVADGGDMVITVSNAGWKTSGTGTITFDDIGDGCTLQYINNKWYCIGQNGVTFG